MLEHVTDRRIWGDRTLTNDRQPLGSIRFLMAYFKCFGHWLGQIIDQSQGRISSVSFCFCVRPHGLRNPTSSRHFRSIRDQPLAYGNTQKHATNDNSTGSYLNLERKWHRTKPQIQWSCLSQWPAQRSYVLMCCGINLAWLANTVDVNNNFQVKDFPTLILHLRTHAFL